ncbi:hypothetical protein AC579_6445 [Pseudocercospora musae]|uniref:Cell wall mannoprotein 1 n=1 Tax=Pseudocercospora musae TaxID=113226 RepID=A0A139IK68_9PEZI|nr:hypothetical protein AC579_6445 [Pseudocercospora musae]
MRFSLALFATSALASSLLSRQTTGLPADIATIQAKTEALTTAIEAYQGEVSQALAVNGAAGEVNDAVQAATTTANGLPEIAQNDAIGLVNPIQDLAKAVNTSVTALISKKDAFTNAGLSGAVLSTLQTQSKASQALSDAIVSKLPAGLQGTGTNLAKPIADSFAAGIAAYSSGASGSSSAASAPSSAAATMTGAPATASATATGSVTAPTVAPGVTNPAANGTSPSVASYTPEPYTGAAMPTAAAGLGIVAVAALVAAF